jgi:predicted DNA-binding mobile mystery protein A
MNKKSLQIQQLNSKMQAFDHLANVAQPPTGWVKAIRTTLGMSLLQLGNKLNITKQSVQNLEKREKNGTISLKALREAARALDMELVYGFIPNDGSLDALIERKAKQLAIQIVRRTSNSMKLEDQENSIHRLEKAVKERNLIIKTEMPKALWD